MAIRCIFFLEIRDLSIAVLEHSIHLLWWKDCQHSFLIILWKTIPELTSIPKHGNSAHDKLQIMTLDLHPKTFSFREDLWCSAHCLSTTKLIALGSGILFSFFDCLLTSLIVKCIAIRWKSRINWTTTIRVKVGVEDELRDDPWAWSWHDYNKNMCPKIIVAAEGI